MPGSVVGAILLGILAVLGYLPGTHHPTGRGRNRSLPPASLRSEAASLTVEPGRTKVEAIPCSALHRLRIQGSGTFPAVTARESARLAVNRAA
jgi:hypothetical protein